MANLYELARTVLPASYFVQHLLTVSLFMPVPGRVGAHYFAKYPLVTKSFFAASHCGPAARVAAPGGALFPLGRAKRPS